MARSLVNPNTLGRAYIDDFEGSRDYSSLGIRRGVWTLSSAPLGRQQVERGRLAWFTPDSKIFDPRNKNSDGVALAIERFQVLEIFPNRDVPSLDERMDVLEWRYFPKEDSAGFFNSNSWGGIMRWLPEGLQNQQETQQLELWVALEEGKPAPKLHFDFGKISEDINGDKNWQTEDTARIGIVEPNKDVGLDGLPNEREPGYDPVSNPDPNKDDFIAPGRSTDDAISLDNINGTEKNASDPERLSRPDNEDLNKTGMVTPDNSYFSFVVDLADTTQFMVPGSYRVDQYRERGGQILTLRPNEKRSLYWRQIRIPLKDSTLSPAIATKTGSPSWSSIEFVRIWLEGAPDTTRLVFATLDLVSNRWKELGVFDDSLKPVTDSQKVRVSVINSQEHPAYREDPPPGVSEVLNRVTNLREREQSLVLTYENIQPGNAGFIQRVLLSGVEDYSGYRLMKMLVHGDRRMTASDSILFFFRFGSGTQNDPNNFYEYRVRLLPGWDPANEVVLDFNRLTNLKNVLNKSRREAGITTGVGDTTDGNYRVRGNPSLASVRWYVMGVENQGGSPVTGEVWTDELLLTEVRRDPGMAVRFHLSTQLSDFGSVNLQVSQQEATFRSLTGGGGSGTLSYNRSASTNEALSLSGSFQAHKLLPRFIPITSLPVLVNWGRTRSTPRLRTGSDIVLTDEFAEAERSEQVRRGFTITPSMRRTTENWLWNLTFNRMNGDFTYSYFRSSDVLTRFSEQRAYSASMNYDLSPRSSFGFRPFDWLPSFWILKKLEKSKFSPLPGTFTLSGNVARTQRVTVLNDLLLSRSSSYVRDFNGRAAASFRLFPNLTTDFNFTTRRDISNPQNLVFSTNPRRFKLGLELERNQDFRSTYNPALFGFADTRFTFSSNYREAGGLAVSSDGRRTINASNGYGASVNLNLTRLFGNPRPPSPDEEARKIEKQRTGEAERRKKEEEKKKKEEAALRAKRWPLDSARIADSLARVAVVAESLAAAAAEAIPVETRFRESMERFVPLPVPALGLVLPLLGPPRAPKDAVQPTADSAARIGAPAKDSLSPPAAV
ncbi:MAG: cell surface protein SprA, partial [Candidatus Zixiibacteriota bacterium]